MTVGIIDYGVGNLGSIVNSLRRLNNNVSLINNPSKLADAESYILPGVGAFSDCMNILDKDGWSKLIKENVVNKKKPILGICIGMQLLATHGEEGAANGKLIKGLDLIPGTVKSLLNLGCNKRLPHVGWNNLINKKENKLLEKIENGTDFYFVHSYAFYPQNFNDVIASIDYGISIPCIIHKDNIWGTQFHPEKSSKAGFMVLKNFISINNAKN